jgi:competence protein ComEC
MFERLREMPFAALTPCLAAGILLSRLTADTCFPLLAVGTALLVTASAIAFERDHTLTAALISCCAVDSCGLITGLADAPGIAEASIPFQLSRCLFPLGQILQFEGCLVEEPRQYQDETLLTLELRGFRHHDQWRACRGGVYVRMPRIAPRDPETVAGLRPGDRVTGWATWQPPRSYLNPGSQDRAELLRERGIHLIGRVKSPRVLETIPGDCGNPLASLVTVVRGRFRGALEHLREAGKGRQSAILASIVLGDATHLDTETRDAFQNSGTYHVLVVSGLHVVWIAWLLLRTFRWLRFPEGASRALILLGILAYISVVGNQTSISRALWTYALYTLGEVIYRRGHPANVALASAFLLLVLCPSWLFDIGFQLSFLSVLAITMAGVPVEEEVLRPLLSPSLHAGRGDHMVIYPGSAGRLGRRLRIEGELISESIGDLWRPGLAVVAQRVWRILAGIAMAVCSMVLVSIAVQIWLEPLLAYYFNRLSWISPLANLFIVPFSSIVLAVGGIATLCSAVSASAEILLVPAGWLASLLFELSRSVSGIPHAWTRCPTPPGAWVLASTLVLFAVGISGRRNRWLPCLGTGMILTALVFAPSPGLGVISDHENSALPETGPSRRILRLTFLDVGQGDSAAIRFPDSRVWVVDAGGTRTSSPEDNGIRNFDIGEAVVSRYLWHRWARTLDRLVLSHPHQDHAGGMPALLRNFIVGEFVYGDPSLDPVLAWVKTVAAGRHVPVSRVAFGHCWDVGGVRVIAFAPPDGQGNRSANDGSVVLHLSYGRFSALLPGDIEGRAEREIVSLWGNRLRSDLVKVAHHGSPSSTTMAFLDRAHPRWAVISAARNNPYGNPAPAVVLRLARRGTLPLLTMDHGAVIFETDGVCYRLASHVAGLIASGSLKASIP